jgi:outer membrane protein OmpA-like peptidoglycan-associated protein
MENQQPSTVPDTPVSPKEQNTEQATTPPQAPEPTTTVPPAIPTNVPPVNKSKKTFIIIGAILATLIIIAVTVYFLLFSPAALAQKASTAFMGAATTSNVDELVRITDGEGSRAYLEDVSENIAGEYKQTEKTSKDSKFYFLYELQGSNSKYARTIAEKMDGEWTVTSIVHGDSPLALVPGDSTSTAEVAEDTSPPEAVVENKTAGNLCLTNDDYKYFFFDKKASSVDYVSKDSYGYLSQAQSAMFFEPDSTKETSFSSIYDDWAEFATKNLDKSWEFHLKGTTYDAGGNSAGDPTSVKLAADRSQKVKAALVSRGVPENRIIVDPAINNNKEYLDGGSNAEIFRRVDIAINNPCAEDGLAPGASR